MTASTIGEREAGRARWQVLLGRAVVGAPDRLVVILFWACVVVALSLQFGIFRPYVVVPALFVLVAATWRGMPSRLPVTRANIISSLGALTLAAGWVVVNIPFASRYLVVDRDPGFLTLAAVRLTTQGSATAPLGPELQAVIDAIPGLSAESPGYYHVGDILYTQGASLLPGLLATLGWVGGIPRVMDGNLVIGGLALLSVYSLARRIVGCWWALAPMVGLGLTVPFAAFTRSGYTEPVTLALVFAGLVLVWDGLSHRRVWLTGLGGAMIGSAALARIDGAAPVIGLVLAMGIAAAFSLAPRVRRWLLVGFAIVTVCALVPVGVGYLDLRLHSPVYLNDLASQFRLLTVALGGAVIVALAINAIGIWRGPRRLVLKNRRALGAVAAAVVVIIAVVLISRPLWYEAKHNAEGSTVAGLIAGLQAQEGFPVSPTSSYDEHSVTWIAWYLGWPCVVLGFAGLALLAYRAVANRDVRHLVLLAVFGLPSLMYLWRVSITPDQIWAMRRFLPITIPGLIVCAAILLAALWSVRRRFVRYAAIVLAVICFAFPVQTWGDLFTGVVHGGRYGQIQSICDAVDGKPVIVYDFGSDNAAALVPAIRTICGVDVLRATEELSADEIAEAGDVWGADVAVVSHDPALIPWATTIPPEATVISPITNWERTLTHRPTGTTTNIESIWVGHVGPDGTVAGVAPTADR